jgi:nucleotide-binding universal stress UspA family protein
LDEARAITDEGVAFGSRTGLGRPAEQIVEGVGSGGIDHVGVGSHGRRGLSRILLGSVAETVVRRSPVSVTIIRSPDEE